MATDKWLEIIETAGDYLIDRDLPYTFINKL